MHDQDDIANVRDIGMSAAVSTHTEIALTEYEVRFSSLTWSFGQVDLPIEWCSSYTVY